MKLSRLLALLTLLLVGLPSCNRAPDQAFDKVAGASIHTILLLQVEEASLRVLGGDKEYLDPRIEQQAKVGKELTAELRSELERVGFQVTVSDVLPRIASEDGMTLEKQYYYADIDTRADAILHVEMNGAGYVKGYTSAWPWLRVQARLLKGDSKKQLYSRRITYGWDYPAAPLIPALAHHGFTDLEAVSKDPDAAAKRLQFGAKLVAAAIAQQLH